MDDQTKYSIISKLQLELDPKEIADELDVSYSSVLRMRKQYNEAVENNTVHELVNIEKLMLEELKDKYPLESVERLTKGIEGLENLQDQFQATALLMNQKIKGFAQSATTAGELSLLVDMLCDLQIAFVNKNMTQVNVQNNFGSESQPYAGLLNDAPGE